jgi:hypothetical protein
MTPREIIEAEYGRDSRNFITPHRLGIGKIPGGAYELSTGTGISREPIWGVSVVRLNEDGTTHRDTDACQLFHTRAAARSYIRSLRRLTFNGLTWYEWARELFETEWCAECGKGVRGHIPSIAPFGAWFAMCKVCPWEPGNV